jgi:conflict system STAND superfamily ATPase
MTNPYANRAALRNGEDFFGRTRELQEIYDLVVHGLCISLVGERRVGKTSLLIAAASDEKRQAFHIPQELRFLMLNAQYFSSADESDVIALLLDRCVQDLGITVDGDGRDQLRRVGQQLKASGERLVLMFDEVDVLVHNPRISPRFFSFLRAWTEEFQVAFVVASREGSVELLVETEGAGSPFWNIFRPIYIGPLRPEEARELIRTPAQRLDLPFTDAEVDAILDLGGHHPFFLQIACYCLFKAKTSGVAVGADQILEDFRFEALAHLEYLISRLSEAERRALVLLVSTGRSPEGRTRSDLLRKGVVIQDGDRLRLFSRVLTDVLRAHESSTARTSLTQRTSDFFFG